jgi:hypothetical protein
MDPATAGSRGGVSGGTSMHRGSESSAGGVGMTKSLSWTQLPSGWRVATLADRGDEILHDEGVPEGADAVPRLWCHDQAPKRGP